MSLATRFQTSRQLLEASLRVLRSHPELLWFPALATVCGIALALFFLLPVIGLGIAAAGGGAPDWLAQINGLMRYAYGVLIYLTSMVGATFFNVALYEQLMRAFAGEPVSVSAGLRFALSRWRAILMWSLLAATVGLIIRTIEERLGWIGKIVLGLIGTGWSVAAVFAIPVIIRRNDSNPLAVLRDSALTLKRTWGESLIGFVGIQLGGAVFALISIGFGLVAAFWMFTRHGFWIWPAIIGMWLLSVFIWSFFIGITTHVYRCALYVYATEGVAPEPYSAEMMNAAWKVKKA
jgi:hypothetical protein